MVMQRMFSFHSSPTLGALPVPTLRQVLEIPEIRKMTGSASTALGIALIPSDYIEEWEGV